MDLESGSVTHLSGRVRSFEPDDRRTVTDARGQRAHEAHVAQSARLQRRLYSVGDDAWCLVGNGLSNQSFVRGPEGIIAIDTGESIEEMRAAIAELRTVTDAPPAAGATATATR